MTILSTRGREHRGTGETPQHIIILPKCSTLNVRTSMGQGDVSVPEALLGPGDSPCTTQSPDPTSGWPSSIRIPWFQLPIVNCALIILNGKLRNKLFCIFKLHVILSNVMKCPPSASYSGDVNPPLSACPFSFVTQYPIWLSGQLSQYCSACIAVTLIVLIMAQSSRRVMLAIGYAKKQLQSASA